MLRYEGVEVEVAQRYLAEVHVHIMPLIEAENYSMNYEDSGNSQGT